MGRIPQDRIFEGGPGLEWEMDVAWVIRGGADPLAWIEKYKDRITAAHVKDIAPAGENTDEDGWSDVGHGTVDWKSIMAALRKIGVKHFVMEHDNPKDDARFATRSIASAKGF
jgi:sugar phosphate isomerase/epimerase